MLDEAKNNAVAKKWGAPPFTKWMDVTASGMRLYLAVYQTGRRLVVENGDKRPDAMRRLGFHPTGKGYWHREELSFRPIDFKDVIPEAVSRRDMPISDIILDLSEAGDPPLDHGTAALNDFLKETSKTFLGFNRRGDEVFEDDKGQRGIVNKQSVWTEADGVMPPDLFLRAGDAEQTSGCALGFVRTIEATPTASHAKSEAFRRTIGKESDADSEAFKRAVTAAAVSLLCRDEGPATDLPKRARRLTDILTAAGLEPQADLEAIALATQQLRAKA